MPTIELTELDLATLKELGGGAPFMQIQRLLAAAVEDCQRRPGETRDRSVAIKIKISPKSHIEQEEDGHAHTVLDGLSLAIESDCKLPNRKSMEFDCGVGEGNKILFNKFSPHNHRQPPLPGFDPDAPPSTVPYGMIIDGKTRAVSG